MVDDAQLILDLQTPSHASSSLNDHQGVREDHVIQSAGPVSIHILLALLKSRTVISDWLFLGGFLRLISASSFLFPGSPQDFGLFCKYIKGKSL